MRDFNFSKTYKVTHQPDEVQDERNRRYRGKKKKNPHRRLSFRKQIRPKKCSKYLESIDTIFMCHPQIYTMPKEQFSEIAQ